MADFTDSYMSGLYPDQETADIEQKLQYKYVKAFPSVNSTNNGQIYSEPNVRWLTKQFTKKPFIIQHEGNPDKDMFKHGEPVLHGTYVDGGMANIDGYIISSSNDITRINFDDTEDVTLGTDGNGLVVTQIAQQTIMKIYNNLENSDLLSYLNVSLQDVQDAYDTWVNSKISQQIGLIDIYYSDSDELDVTGYIDKLIADGVFTIVTLENPDGDFQVYTYTIGTETFHMYHKSYPIYVGQPEALYKIGEVSSDGKFTEDKDIPIIYFIDNFGCIFTFYNSDERSESTEVLYTHTYPSTGDNRINMSAVKDTSGLDDSSIIDKTASDTVYDFNPIYANNTEIIDNVTVAHRDNSATPTEVSLTNILNNDKIFTKVTAEELIHSYCLYMGIEDESSVVVIPSCSEPLPDILYCLYNGNATKFGQVVNKLSRTIPNTEIKIPIAFMNSAGRLVPYNVDFYRVNQDSSIEPLTVAEGYVTFMRRLARSYMNDATTWTNLDGNFTFNQDYLNNPNGDNFSNSPNSTVIADKDEFLKNWENVFKYIEEIGCSSGVITNLTNTESGTAIFTTQQAFQFYDEWTTYSDPSKIKFHNLYNTFIAPYVNIYTQLGWSSVYTNTRSSVADKFLLTKDWGNLRTTVPTESINYDKYWRGEVKCTHIYSRPNSVSITQNYNLTIDNDLKTDNQRFNINLCDLEELTLINSNTDVDFKYRTKLDFNNLTIANYEDYISYYKRLAWTTRRNINYRTNAYSYLNLGVYTTNRIIIPYRVTSLNEIDNTNIGETPLGTIKNIGNFVVDDINRLYWDTTGYPVGHLNPEDISAAIGVEISKIQNIPLDTLTLLPIDMGAEVAWVRETPTSSYVSKDRDFLDSLTYNISMNTMITSQRDKIALRGVDGINFKGLTQGWTTYVPMIFRLFKDSQNYLGGRISGTSESSGITIDYKFPFELINNDMWFGTLWMSTVRNVATWNVETNGIPHSKFTDGLAEYWTNRNLTIFGTDKIYGLDENGNYISFEEYVASISDEESTIIVDNLKHELEQEISEAEGRLNQTIDTDIATVNSRIDNHYYYNEGVEDTVANINVHPNDYIDYSDDTLTAIYTHPTRTSFSVLDAENPVAEKFTIRCKVNGSLTLGLENLDTYVEESWVTNYESIYRDTANPPRTEITITTALNKVVDTLIDITYTPNGNVCDVHFIDVDTAESSDEILTNKELTNLIIGLYDLESISWNQVHTLTEQGLAPKFWNVGDSKKFKVTAQDPNDSSHFIDYEFEANIIAFDKQKNLNRPHIIWMTNFHNSGIDLSTADGLEDWNKEFACNLGYEYVLLTTEPSDWGTNWTDYYTKSGDDYIPVTDASRPTFETDTYYRLDLEKASYQKAYNNTPPYEFGLILSSNLNYPKIESGMMNNLYDLSSSVNTNLSSFNIHCYGDNYSTEVTEPTVRITTDDTPTYFYQPSLVELGITDNVRLVDTVEEALYEEKGDVRLNNYIGEINSISYGINGNLPSGFKSRPIILRDCFALYDPDHSSDVDANFVNKERRLIFAYVSEGATLNDPSTIVLYSSADVADPPFNNSLPTEFCFITI